MTMKIPPLPSTSRRQAIAGGLSLAASLALPALGPSSLYLNLNRVSDDDYWRDFSRNSASLTQRLLASDEVQRFLIEIERLVEVVRDLVAPR